MVTYCILPAVALYSFEIYWLTLSLCMTFGLVPATSIAFLNSSATYFAYDAALTSALLLLYGCGTGGFSVTIDKEEQETEYSTVYAEIISFRRKVNKSREIII